MATLVQPLRAISRTASCNVQRFTLSPGLQLRLNARQFARQAAHAPRKAAQGRQSGAKSNVLGLLTGVGIAFWAMPSSTMRMEPWLGSGGGARSDKFNFDPNSSNPFGGDELPKSDVNLYNLGFGSVCGICAGVFIKKGLKLVAFLLGGAFVLLQYLNTQKIINVNWRALESRYDSAVDNASGQDAIDINDPASRTSGWRDSRAVRIWNRFVHFLTADFPSRGTFVAGLLLGLRLG